MWRWCFWSRWIRRIARRRVRWESFCLRCVEGGRPTCCRRWRSCVIWWRLRNSCRRWHIGGTSYKMVRRGAVAIVASSVGQLRALIREAHAAVEQDKAVEGDWIFYTPAPLGVDGKVAFVYPGSGMQFAGMGRELAAAFPEILRRQDAENLRLASQFGGMGSWDGGAIDSIAPRDVIFAQVSLGCFVTDLLEAFGVKPKAVIGYSLGESTGLFATRAWKGRDEMLARMHASTLFTSDLTGACDAARRAWKLAADEKVDWVVGVINRSGEMIRREIAGRERVFLLIVNSPSECVIGGDRSAVEKLVSDVGAAFHAVRDVTTVHCDIAKQVEEEYRALHLLETTPPSGVRFYSSALGAAYDVTRESAAESIVRQAVEPFDFTKVIEGGVSRWRAHVPGGWAGRELHADDWADFGRAGACGAGGVCGGAGWRGDAAAGGGGIDCGRCGGGFGVFVWGCAGGGGCGEWSGDHGADGWGGICRAGAAASAGAAIFGRAGGGCVAGFAADD